MLDCQGQQVDGMGKIRDLQLFVLLIVVPLLEVLLLTPIGADN